MEFTQRMQDLYPLSEDSIRLLQENLERVEVAKKEVVISEGQNEYYTYFVERGSARGYFLREGKYITLMFAFEGNMIATIPGLSDRLTSKMTVEALEDSVFLRISRTRLEELFTTTIELANWGRKLVEKNLLEHEHFFLNYFWADKSTQYRTLLKEYPEILQRVSLRELASYLDVTPQTLSRIRANIRY